MKKLLRTLPLLVLPLVLVACRGEQPADDAPDTAVEAAPEIVELGDPVEPASTDPISGETGLVAVPVGEIPADWHFVERSGETMSFADLRGKYVVVDFVFTSCPGPCPPMMGQMSDLQARLAADAGTDDVRLLSISVDPKNDTIEALAEYAEMYEADPDLWFLARMPIGFVNMLTREILKVGDGGNPLVHSTKFVLVDDEGRGRGYYDPLVDEGWVAKILSDLETLRGETP